MFGTNDISRHPEMSHKQIAKRITDTVDSFSFKEGSTVVVGSLLPRNDDEDNAASVNRVNKKLKYMVCHEMVASSFNLEFLDTRAIFKSSAERRANYFEVAANADLLAYEGLHLNEKGLSLYSRQIRMVLKKREPESFASHHVPPAQNFNFNRTFCQRCKAIGHGNNGACHQYLYK